MFANDDFDLDEDFLQDISQKESQYYSQTSSTNEELPNKRSKIDKNSPKESGSISSSNLENVIHRNSKQVGIQYTNESSSNKPMRRNLILERLKRNENIAANPSIQQHASTLGSKSVVLEKLNFAQEPSLNSVSTASKKIPSVDISKKNDVGGIPSSLRSSKEEFCSTNSQEVSKSHSKPKYGNTISESSLVVRKFPGPAGLLRHSTEMVPTLISKSPYLDDNNDSINTDVIGSSSMMSKYCSQNTKNSFSEGAWQLLTSDLSPGFLKGHEISTIQQKALTNSYRYNKVPFLAGIVQWVDYSCPDPLVVLKDCTGTIEGTICKDILVEYPHSLDIGAVLFLGNVGLLTIGSYLKKCHIIVTLKNIINIYTGRDQIFTISEMDARLKILNNRSYSGEFVRNQAFTSSGMKDVNPQSSPNKPKNSSNSGSRTNSVCRSLMRREFSDRTDQNIDSATSKTLIDKCTNLPGMTNKNLNSFEAHKNFLPSTDHTKNTSTFESEDIEDFDDDFTASFLDMDNLISEAKTSVDPTLNRGTGNITSVPMNKHVAVIKKNSELDVPHSNETLSPETEHLISNPDTGKSLAPYKKKTGVPETKSSDIKLKLSVFRSKTELTPESCEDLADASTEEILKQSYKPLEPSFTSGSLFDRGYDSDEAVFSQLDMESIVSHYDELNNAN